MKIISGGTCPNFLTETTLHILKIDNYYYKISVKYYLFLFKKICLQLLFFMLMTNSHYMKFFL